MLDAAALRPEAEQRARLADPAQALFRPSLERLVASINAEAGLSDEGAAAVAANLVRRGLDRPSGLRWLRDHPEIADGPIDRSLFLADCRDRARAASARTRRERSP